MAAAGRCPSCLGESTRLALHGHLECASFHTQSRTPSINRMATRPALHGRDLNTSARNIYQSHAHGRELNTFSAGTAIGNILCKRKLYECPTSGVFIYLPLFDAEELEVMYRAYNGQAPLTMTHFRPNEQAAMITFAMRLSSWVGPLHVVEAGCANGAFLAVLGASHLLKATPVTSITLSCYEADPKIAPAAQQLLGQLESNSSGRLQARVVRSLFTGADLQPASVDLVSSSHVLEHVTDPCTYVQTLRKVLRPEATSSPRCPAVHRSPETPGARPLPRHVLDQRELQCDDGAFRVFARRRTIRSGLTGHKAAPPHALRRSLSELRGSTSSRSGPHFNISLAKRLEGGVAAQASRPRDGGEGY